MRRTGGITLTLNYSPYSRNEPELGPMIGFNRGSPGLPVFQAQVAGGVGGMATERRPQHHAYVYAFYLVLLYAMIHSIQLATMTVTRNAYNLTERSA